MGSKTTFGALYKKAKDDGAFDDVIPHGEYELTFDRANHKVNQKGDDRIGVHVKVTGGIPEDDPDFGKGTWLNLTFSEAASAIAFRQLGEWGFTDEFLSEAESAEQIADAIAGIVVDATVTTRNWGANGENVSNDIKVHQVLTAPAVGGAKPAEDEEPF